MRTEPTRFEGIVRARISKDSFLDAPDTLAHRIEYVRVATRYEDIPQDDRDRAAAVMRGMVLGKSLVSCDGLMARLPEAASLPKGTAVFLAIVVARKPPGAQ